MKKYLLSFAMMGMLLLCACAAPGYSGLPAPGSTATAQSPVASAPPPPTPTPSPLTLLCYMDTMPSPLDSGAVMDTASNSFVKGVVKTAEALGYVVTLAYEATDAAGFDYAVFLRTRPDTEFVPPAEGVTAALADATGPVSAEEKEMFAYTAAYASDSPAAFALFTAIQYPPHDTPVRMYALLEKEGSPADEAYTQYVSEGKIFNRGVYYLEGEAEDDEESPPSGSGFMEYQLDRFVEGLIDAIYVENIGLAQTALAALSSANRTDMEVFAVPSGDIKEQQALYARYVFPVAMGVDYEAVGRDMVERMHAQSAETDVAFSETSMVMEVAP